MPASVRRTVYLTTGLALILIALNLLHFGGELYKFMPLFGAIFGGCLTLASIGIAHQREGQTLEPWAKNERIGWICIGCGQLLWAIGESFWRYYQAQHQSPFPSLADAGYVFFPILCFVGLLLQPGTGTKIQRSLVALDSFIAMGALLAISWYFLLGSLAQAQGEDLLAKFLGLYYPITDVCLLSCVVLLLLRTQSEYYQAPARKISLLAMGLGFCFFVCSDFNFNVQQNLQTYVDGTWLDLGWPLGIMAIGLAAYLRSTLPQVKENEQKRKRYRRDQALGISTIQLLPYVPIAALFLVLALNVLSSDPAQVHIRLVLLLATIGVIALAIVRQIITINMNIITNNENIRLSHMQEEAYKQIEEQARHITEYNAELAQGIAHLKAVQTSLASGNPRARAHIQEGVLGSLGNSLNILAERQRNLGEAKRRLDLLSQALSELGQALEKRSMGQALQFSASCEHLPELRPLLHALVSYERTRTAPPLQTPPSHTRPLGGAQENKGWADYPTHTPRRIRMSRKDLE